MCTQSITVFPLSSNAPLAPRRASPTDTAAGTKDEEKVAAPQPIPVATATPATAKRPRKPTAPAAKKKKDMVVVEEEEEEEEETIDPRR